MPPPPPPPPAARAPPLARAGHCVRVRLERGFDSEALLQWPAAWRAEMPERPRVEPRVAPELRSRERDALHRQLYAAFVEELGEFNTTGSGKSPSTALVDSHNAFIVVDWAPVDPAEREAADKPEAFDPARFHANFISCASITYGHRGCFAFERQIGASFTDAVVGSERLRAELAAQCEAEGVPFEAPCHMNTGEADSLVVLPKYRQLRFGQLQPILVHILAHLSSPYRFVAALLRDGGLAMAAQYGYSLVVDDLQSGPLKYGLVIGSIAVAQARMAFLFDLVDNVVRRATGHPILWCEPFASYIRGLRTRLGASFSLGAHLPPANDAARRFMRAPPTVGTAEKAAAEKAAALPPLSAAAEAAQREFERLRPAARL